LETIFILFVSIVFFVYLCGMNDELDNILKKVSQLYRKFGIRSVTMDDVSRELGISKKTLYQYVRDKDELVHKVIEMEVAAHESKMTINCTFEQNAIEQLLEIARCISIMLKDYSPSSEYDLKKYYPDLYLKMRDLRRSHAFRFIDDNLKKGIAEGLYRNDVDPDIIAKLSVALIDSLVDGEIITIEEFLERKFFLEFLIYHMRGIANAKGLAFIESQLSGDGLMKWNEPQNHGEYKF
jgi:AcrR family transcriptional regulator